jgi:hypothetical protein
MNHRIALLGKNTFLPIYNLLSRTGVVEHPGFYPKGYYIPMWTNSATYLRDIDSDFGPIGLMLIPYLLGLFSTYFWYRFYINGSLNDFIALNYIYQIVAFSVFYMVTRSSVWFLSMIIVLITFAILNMKIEQTKTVTSK